MRIGIVTGASSGLGREFVKQISEKEHLDEVWAIARRENRLRQLKEQTKMPVRPIGMDLTDGKSFLTLRKLLENEKPNVRILINAAGYGRMGNYADIPLEDNSGMIDLNCRALVNMTLTVLPYMNRGARIMEICSSSAFQPLPGLNVYAASKAFVMHYSRALRWELFSRGVHVTAVCPYWIRDTEFIPVSKKTRNSHAVRHFPFASRVHCVAAHALIDSRLNLPVSTPGIVCFFQRIFAKFIPHEITTLLWEGIRRI